MKTKYINIEKRDIELEEIIPDEILVLISQRDSASAEGRLNDAYNAQIAIEKTKEHLQALMKGVNK